MLLQTKTGESKPRISITRAGQPLVYATLKDMTLSDLQECEMRIFDRPLCVVPYLLSQIYNGCFAMRWDGHVVTGPYERKDNALEILHGMYTLALSMISGPY